MQRSAPTDGRDRIAALRDRAADGVGWLGALLILGFSAGSGGGYFPAEYLAMGLASFLGAAAIVVLRPAPRLPPRRALIAVAGLGTYGAWAGLSGSWSPDPAGAAAVFQRTVSYAGVLVFAIVAVDRGRGARNLVFAVWAVLAGVSIVGMTSRLLPGLGLAPLRDPYFQGYRLSWPISYWNAQGAAAAMALVIAVGVAADRRARILLRATTAATIPALAVALLLTVSRGSIVAAAIGLLVLLVLSPRPLRSAAVLLGCAIPAAAAVAFAASHASIVDDPAASPALSVAGPQAFLVVLALGVVSGLFATGALRLSMRIQDRRRERAMVSRRTSTPPPTTLIVAVLVVVCVLVLTASRLDGPIAGRTVQVRDFVDQQYSAFSSTKPVATSGLDRLGSLRGTRSDAYRVARHEFADAPLIGRGAGAFPLDWLRERRTPETPKNVHSLPLETLAETGIVGFLLLSTFVAMLVRGASLVRARRGSVPRAQAAGAAGGIATFFASSAVDWTWQMGTLTAAMLLLGATMLHDRRRVARN